MAESVHIGLKQRNGEDRVKEISVYLQYLLIIFHLLMAYYIVEVGRHSI